MCRIRPELDTRLKRLQSTITLEGGNPPRAIDFVNEAVASRLAREEKRHGIATPAA